MSGRKFLRILFYFWVVVLSGMSADAADIVLRSQSEPRGAIVLLSDVADVQCEDLGQQARLARLELFPTPAAGTRRWLRARELHELLAIRGEDVTELHLTGAARVSILVPAQEATDVSQPSTPKPAADRAAEAMYLVARRDLLRGDVLREGDLETRPLSELKRSPRNPVTSVDDAVGQQLLRSVAAGQPLDYGTLRRPLWVERGRPVRVSVRVGAVRVTTTGKALDDGARDDVVAVELTDGRKRVIGRVVGLDEVDVAPQGVALVPETAGNRPQ